MKIDWEKPLEVNIQGADGKDTHWTDVLDMGELCEPAPNFSCRNIMFLDKNGEKRYWWATSEGELFYVGDIIQRFGEVRNKEVP